MNRFNKEPAKQRYFFGFLMAEAVEQGLTRKSKIEEQLKYERNASEALKSITAELGISLVDLYCYFNCINKEHYLK